MLKPVVHIENLTLKHQHKLVLIDLNWIINRGENWLLSGKSGSGKTSLVKLIAGILSASGNIKIELDPTHKLPAKTLYVASWYQFKDLEGDSNFYYQQRYNSQQAHRTHTVYTELLKYGQENQLDFENLDHILNALNFTELKDVQLIQLSSGEHKKLQLIKALWLKPQLLILDQPYTGLDALSRKNLSELLNEISTEGVQLIMICDQTELPTCINRFAEIKDGSLTVAKSLESVSVLPKKIVKSIPNFLSKAPVSSSEILISMTDVNISYGEKKVLKHINWEVKAGEKWLLQGHNGSGKSTLLSLINGDHPQAYANNIHLFGNKRGSGESIWEIKAHIGLISPELHWYFDASATVFQSIASGFFDSSGLFKTIGAEKQAQVEELIDYFELNEYKNELLKVLPLGKQRLVLLARTIIKNPELLILDEPCQGLDQQQTEHFNHLIDELCTNGMALIYVGHFETQLPACLTHKLLLNNGEVIENIKAYHTKKELA
ncbi:ATP-binding cassette domain-containing protein [Pedobacter boryungensis]|uniref:ATP-binding cassette domain-containing protein n=1 Tax=Pedobacter boryungensis TaxID=869962 RepID=A0ABX2D9Q0_9SPHI|nr:ATP-binding cassette domain-containing protein [Pedobacter boryungensis]NQX30143.1 ATP-binding cassette domain-containing protein [Pedobacter boryungensis]